MAYFEDGSSDGRCLGVCRTSGCAHGDYGLCLFGRSSKDGGERIAEPTECFNVLKVQIWALPESARFKIHRRRLVADRDWRKWRRKARRRERTSHTHLASFRSPAGRNPPSPFPPPRMADQPCRAAPGYDGGILGACGSGRRHHRKQERGDKAILKWPAIAKAGGQSSLALTSRGIRISSKRDSQAAILRSSCGSRKSCPPAFHNGISEGTTFGWQIAAFRVRRAFLKRRFAVGIVSRAPGAPFNR